MVRVSLRRKSGFVPTEPADSAVLALIDARLAIYRASRDDSDPYGPDIYTRREHFEHTVEALEILREQIAGCSSEEQG